jgi:DNA polymerase III delta prime subunit
VRGKDFVEKWLARDDEENEEMAPHLLLVGRTGSGKTTAAKYFIARALHYYTEVIVLDWDNEYNKILSPSYDPPFLIDARIAHVTDAVTEVERSEGSGHGVSYFIRKALEDAAQHARANLFQAAAERLRARTLEVSSYALRAALEAALVRLELLAPYVFVNTSASIARALSRGTYKLFKIPSIWTRSTVRQFLSVFHVVARRAALIAYEEEPAIHDPPDPSVLVIEEGSVGATTTYMVHLLTEARKAATRVIIISQRLPDAEIVQNCELLLFDTSPAVRRALHAAIPDSRLRVGEAWWVRRDGEAKRISFR